MTLLSDKKDESFDGNLPKFEPMVSSFKEFFYHLRHTTDEQYCPNCGKLNTFTFKDIVVFRMDDNGSATYKCRNWFCNFSFHIEPLRKESS